MYAVIKTGGKQYRVAEGERVQVERLDGGDDGDISFIPLLVVDGESVLAGVEKLAGASVAGRVVGTADGPKITGFKYKNKSRQSRRWGHRQHYSVIEITGISKG